MTDRNSLIVGDCLQVLPNLEENSVDLVYMDPPFNSNTVYSAKEGTMAEGATFSDKWRLSTSDEEWIESIEHEKPTLHRALLISPTDTDKAYLAFMAARLLQVERVVKPSGSIYLHCDPTMSHYLKILMDSIFGRKSFQNEIIWRIGWVSGFKTRRRSWIRNHDTILYYSADSSCKPTFNKNYIPYPLGYVRRDGKPPVGKGFPLEDTWNCSKGDSLWPVEDTWNCSTDDVLDSIMIKSFSQEKTGYPTQKPISLLKRIVEASSNEGDLVLDPFCGSGTTLLAAKTLNRRYIGIDISARAIKVSKERLT